MATPSSQVKGSLWEGTRQLVGANVMVSDVFEVFNAFRASEVSKVSMVSKTSFSSIQLGVSRSRVSSNPTEVRQPLHP